MKFKIVFFDCDGVLMFGAPWLQLHKSMGITEEEDQKWFDDCYSGRITQAQWRDNVVNRYKKSGLTRDKFEDILDLDNYTFNDQAYPLIKYLKKNNIKIAIVSSGINYYVSKVAKHFGIDDWRDNANFIFDENDEFKFIKFGEDDTDAKVTAVKEICQSLNISPQDCIFIGDSNNDAKALELTKHGILYKTQDSRLEKIAWKRVNDLREIISILEDAANTN